MSRKNGKVINCENCNKKFYRSKSELLINKRFYSCSKKCSDILKTGFPIYHSKKTYEKIAESLRTGFYIACDYCNKPTYIIPSLLKKNKNFFCNHHCHSKWQIGKKLKPRSKASKIRSSIALKNSINAKESIIKRTPKMRKTLLRKYASGEIVIWNKGTKCKYHLVNHRIRNAIRKGLKRYCNNPLIKFKSTNYFNIDWEGIIKKLKPTRKKLDKFHIDHIIPLSKFNFNSKKEIEKAISPNNLQWLPPIENIKKSNKI